MQEGRKDGRKALHSPSSESGVRKSHNTTIRIRIRTPGRRFTIPGNIIDVRCVCRKKQQRITTTTTQKRKNGQQPLDHSTSSLTVTYKSRTVVGTVHLIHSQITQNRLFTISYSSSQGFVSFRFVSSNKTKTKRERDDKRRNKLYIPYLGHRRQRLSSQISSQIPSQ